MCWDTAVGTGRHGGQIGLRILCALHSVWFSGSDNPRFDWFTRDMQRLEDVNSAGGHGPAKPIGLVADGWSVIRLPSAIHLPLTIDLWEHIIEFYTCSLVLVSSPLAFLPPFSITQVQGMIQNKWSSHQENWCQQWDGDNGDDSYHHQYCIIYVLLLFCCSSSRHIHRVNLAMENKHQ
jgi:hypothetical protein